MSIRRLQKFMMYEEMTPAEADTETVKQNSSNGNPSKNSKQPNAKENTKENNASENNSNENSKEDTTKRTAKEEELGGITDDKMQQTTDHTIEHRVSIENGTAKWLEHDREDTLQNITMKVRPGELIAVVGQVGAGKSSLLNVILKELRLREGSVQVSGFD